MNMDFKSAKELLDLCEENQLPISEVMRQRECILGEVPRDAVDHRMAKAWEIMRASATQPLKKPIKSMGGLIGGEAKKLETHYNKKKNICGDVLQKAMTYAMAVLEVNASMGLIVAAPTAGSAGVVPGMMLALQECYRISDQRIVDALFNAGAVGYLAMRNATVAGAVGGLYDFVVSTFGAWTESVSTRICDFGAMCADKFKVVFGLNTGAAVLGLGYIIGLKYATIITAGSCLVWFLVVPLVGSLADTIDPAAMASLLGVTRADILADPASIFTAENLFAFIGKPLGIGGIAMAGIIGIIRQSKIIRQAVGLAVSELGGGNKTAPAAVERTQRDLTMKRILTILIATLISVFVFFHFGLLDGWIQSVTAILIVFVIAFLFTTVAANAIAIVGTNPVSGMTLMTLILSSLVLVSVGLSGTTGMTAALIIGGVVCTALSMAGGFITDLKIGYWLGTTPRKQEAWKFLGTFVAAATVAGVMIILNKSYGFVGEGALVAPQANAMAAVIQPLMTGGQTPWMLYFCGAALALVLTSIGVPALAFALGMFIPMELNAPLVVGGLVAWFVSNRSKDEGLNKARFDRGTLIASGFIAGGALMGVVSAVLKFVGVDWFLSGWASSNAAEWTGLAMYLVLIGYFAWHTLRAKKEE